MNYKEGLTYRYSEIPEYSTDEYQINDYGAEYLGQNAQRTKLRAATGGSRRVAHVVARDSKIE